MITRVKIRPHSLCWNSARQNMPSLIETLTSANRRLSTGGDAGSGKAIISTQTLEAGMSNHPMIPLLTPLYRRPLSHAMYRAKPIPGPSGIDQLGRRAPKCDVIFLCLAEEPTTDCSHRSLPWSWCTHTQSRPPWLRVTPEGDSVSINMKARVRPHKGVTELLQGDLQTGLDPGCLWSSGDLAADCCK